MAATLEIGRLTLGDGSPKIIVPIVGASEDTILAAAQEIAVHPLIDLVEWRADYYDHAFDSNKTIHLLEKLQAILQGKPLLYTFRTAREGGQKEIAAAQYALLCESAAHVADLVDVEMFSTNAAACVYRVQQSGARVVGSWHDFQ